MRRIWAIVLAAGLLAVPAVASAHGSVRNDGNDTRGPLDLSSAAVGRKGTSAVTHTLTTFASWKPKLLRNGSYFAVAFDTNDDPTTFERCAFAFYSKGLRGEFSNCGRHRLGKVQVRKVSAQSIEFTVALSKLLPSGGDYHWAAFSFYRNDHACKKVCSDAIPNHAPLLLHDLTPPQINLRSFPDPTTTASPTTTFPVEFGVSDNGGSGIASWKLRDRPVGGTGWSVVSTGTDGGHQTVNVQNANEGDQLEFQVIAVDQQGNRAASAPSQARLTVPVDDKDPTIIYSGTDWTSPGSGNGGYFEGSRHRTTVANATATINYTGSKLRILGGPSTATATLVVDGTSLPVTLTETPTTTKRQVIGTANVGPGPHTGVITVNSGTFILDGYAAS